MTATKRVGGSDNILARLDRNDGAARPHWSRAMRATLAGAAVALVALVWMLVNMTQDKMQAQRGAQVIVATPEAEAPPPAPATAAGLPELSLEAQAAAQIDATFDTRNGTPPVLPDKRPDAPLEPASLEPIPVLPMLADVVEKAPAAPAPRAAARTPRARPGPAAQTKGSASTMPRAGERHGALPAPTANSADPAVDGDIALLSAILLHAPRHSAERAKAEAKCRLDKHCTWAGPLSALLQATH